MSTFLYLLCGAVAVVGRLFGLVLSGRRELANKHRELRLQVLVSAWRRIERGASREGEQDARELEQAIADIQLFGSPAQTHQAASAALSINEEGIGSAALDDLVESLRGDLRAEMHLAHATNRVVHLRSAPSPGSVRVLTRSLSRQSRRPQLLQGAAEMRATTA